MAPDIILLMVYRLMALAIALAMVVTILRSGNWRTQFYATLVLIPFALRAAGVK